MHWGVLATGFSCPGCWLLLLVWRSQRVAKPLCIALPGRCSPANRAVQEPSGAIDRGLFVCFHPTACTTVEGLAALVSHSASWRAAERVPVPPRCPSCEHYVRACLCIRFAA